jgi:MraZ protein
MDDKGRLAIPARYRVQLGDGLFVTRGLDSCLLGFPRAYWDSLAQKVSSLPLGQMPAREVQRRLFSGAADLTLDRQGRILIPQNLRAFAALGEQVVISGMNDYFEIWSRERWNDMLNRIESNSSGFAEQLAALGI